MKLLKLIKDRKKKIVKKWIEYVISTYPYDTGKFLRTTKDSFANPVGSNISQGLEGVYDELAGTKADQEKVIKFLDPIIRIRAVQDFTPIQAIEFVFSLKKIIRDNLKKELKDSKLLNELLDFEIRIDKVGMIAFDIYLQCKEKLYSIRANQSITKAYKTFKKAGMLVEDYDTRDDKITE